MILDCGVLVSAERSDSAVVGLRQQSKIRGIELHTTVLVVAQAWRGHANQAMLAMFLKGVIIHGVDAAAAHQDGHRVGELMAAAGTKDVVDAHLVLTAHRLRRDVLTGDPDDLGTLADALVGFRPAVKRWPY